jgi:IMP dehydrogenase
MKIRQKCLSFNDVLLMPQKSNICSRKEINIGSSLKSSHYPLPVISSPMDTVTEVLMADTIHSAGGLGILHRYNSINEQAKLVRDLLELGVPNIAAAIGVSGDFEERACALYDAGSRVVCVDVAHGHHILMEKALKTLRDTFGESVTLIAGNVATAEGFLDLQSWGADAIRVGIGGGSICSTRTQTGHGLSTFSSIVACSEVKTVSKLIADGGIKNSGDIVKALAAGADFVMLGSLLAGTDESPGDIFLSKDGKRYKAYRGMASPAAQMDWRGKVSSLEGVSTTIPYKGSVKDILNELAINIRSGFSYSGARNQAELRDFASFVQQTPGAQLESTTHILSTRNV